VTRKSRLEKVEARALEKWRKAWERSATIYDKHAGDIFTDTAEAFNDALQKAHPELDANEIEARMVAFLEGLGVTQYRVFEAWFNSYDIPEDDPPDLTCWPSDIPAPPDERPGEWEKAVLHRHSAEPIPRLAAELYLFLLATARATREEQTEVR